MGNGDPDTIVAAAVSVDEIVITHELEARPAKRPDYRRRNEALQELASRLADDSADVLPRFVEQAMEMTGATSAGLSLYEAEPAPGVFRWHHLHGSLARFEGTTTPRNYSPCGVTLDQNDAVLCSHPERVYDWIAAEDMVIPEVLLVPLLVGSNEPFGTLWMVADSPEHFRLEDVRIARELARFVATALRLSRSEERLREALRQQELLAREMDHRVKNVFAVTESILRLTAAHADSPAALAESLQSRLRALSDAHSLARGGIIGDGSSIDLHELIEAVVSPWNVRRQLTLEGPEIDCGEHCASGLALVIHELATNAVKYGALTKETGRVSIKWAEHEDALLLEWRESGGPEIGNAPDSTGFGTTLIRRTIARQFGGSVDEQWLPDGFVCEMRLARERIQS